MKNFYEFLQILKENEQGAMINQDPAIQLKTGEQRRKHFGIQGTGGGRTDDSVIYNDLTVEYDGDFGGQIIVWFDDHKDLLATIDGEPDEVVNGYGNISGRWSLDYKFTVTLTDNPSKPYPPGPRGWPIGLPNSHGSGIVEIEIDNIEQREDDDDYYDDREPYNPDPDGHGYWDNYWNHGPGRDPD